MGENIAALIRKGYAAPVQRSCPHMNQITLEETLSSLQKISM